MDHSARTDALRTAKSLISSHGIVRYMNKYNRDLLSREVTVDSTVLRYDFLLDPVRDSWAPGNPSCSLTVMYVPETKEGRIAADGSMVLDSRLQVSLGVGGSDMSLEVVRQRESMLSLLMMLCEMLETTLPKKIVSLLETSEQVADKKRRALEQTVGDNIVKNVGQAALKGLRRGGTARRIRLTGSYASADGCYPEPGTYRYRLVRSTDSRGRARDVAHYAIRVVAGHPDCPPHVTIQRLGDVKP